MGILVNTAEVKEILTTSLDDLSPFITAAAQIVDAYCSNNTDAQNKEVQRWLAAHFTRIQDKATSSEAAGPVSRSFQYTVEVGLGQTQYGQQALALDISGGLARWQNQIKTGKTQQASISFIGSTD